MGFQPSLSWSILPLLQPSSAGLPFLQGVAALFSWPTTPSGVCNLSQLAYHSFRGLQPSLSWSTLPLLQGVAALLSWPTTASGVCSPLRLAYHCFRGLQPSSAGLPLLQGVTALLSWPTTPSEGCSPPQRACPPTPSGFRRAALPRDRLVGRVVKASASRKEDPGIKSRLRRDFSGSSHTSALKVVAPVATLPGAWRYRVSAGTCWPRVSIL